MDRRIIDIENIELLEAKILDEMETMETVSVVSNLDTIWDLAMILHDDGVEFELIDIDKYDYNKEYMLTVKDNGSEYTMAIEKAFNEEKEMYFGTDGLIFIDDSVNSRVIIDMKENEFCDPHFVIFSLGSNKDKCSECEIERQQEDTMVVYRIPLCLDFLIDYIDSAIDNWFNGLL